MLRKTCGLAIIVICTSPNPARAQSNPLQQFEKPFDFNAVLRVTPSTIKYGPRYWQTINLYRARGKNKSPLVIYLRSPAWKFRARPYDTSSFVYRLTSEGYDVASISYNLNERKIEGSLADIVQAIYRLNQVSDQRKLDMSQLILVGQDSGAHIATLMGTDEKYILESGLPFLNLKAVISINGNGFDIPRRVMFAKGSEQKAYGKSFGIDQIQQSQYSPVSHLSAPNAPKFLFMAVESEKAASTEALEMSDAMVKAGVISQFMALPEARDGEPMTNFLLKKGGAGQPMMDFLASITAK